MPQDGLRNPSWGDLSPRQRIPMTGPLFDPVREFGLRKGAAMKKLSCLWHDTRGTSSVVSLVLLTSILVVGIIAGMVTLRDQIVQQFGDLSVALESLDQSYSFTVITPSATITSQYVDTSSGLTDPMGFEPAGLDVHTVTGTPEL
jgi:hypothetical protein